MKDHLYIGSVPCSEECAQIGCDNYFKLSQIEGVVFIEQLIRTFGALPLDTFFKNKRNHHDFGAYYEVVVFFESENKASINYAYKVEGNMPEDWDAIAHMRLKELGYKL